MKTYHFTVTVTVKSYQPSYADTKSCRLLSWVPPIPHTGSQRHIGSPTNWRAPQVTAPGPLFGKVLAFDQTIKTK